MNLQQCSNRELLATLVGKRRAMRLAKVPLSVLFQLRTERSIASENPVQYAPELTLSAAKELLARALIEVITTTPIAFSNKQDATDYLRLTLAGRQIEVFLVLFLDAQNRVIASEELFHGTLTQTSVYPREVVKRALAHNAGAVMFAHNHPSGIAEPSQADRHLTSALKQALALVDVRVLDHFIIGEQASCSFAESGWI